eukprot:2313085-Alexandrium_andersonii.AAC.1
MAGGRQGKKTPCHLVTSSSRRSPSWPESAMDWSPGASSFANMRRQSSRSCSVNTNSAGRTRA